MLGHRLPDTVSQVSSSDRCGHHIRGCKCRHLWAQLPSLCFGEGVTMVTFPLLCQSPPGLLSVVHKLSPLVWFHLLCLSISPGLSHLPLYIAVSLSTEYLDFVPSALFITSPRRPACEWTDLGEFSWGHLGPGVPFAAPVQRSWGAVIRELFRSPSFPLCMEICVGRLPSFWKNRSR